MFLLKLSLRPWRLAPMSHLFSAAAVGFLLLVSGFLYWLQDGLKPVVARLQGEQVITAYLEHDNGVDPAKVTDAIRIAVGAHAKPAPGSKPAVQVEYVDSRQFVQNLKPSYPELSNELEDLGPEMAAVVPRYVSVTGLLEDAALAQVIKVPGVESAETSRDRYARVVGAFMALRWVAKLLVLGAAFALLTGLIHLSRLNAYMHREALTILKMWGAGALEMRAPAMISGAMVGAVGGLAAGTAWLVAGDSLSQQIRSLSPMLTGLPTASAAIALGIVGSGILIGVFAGALGGIAPETGTAQGARG